MSLLSGSVLCHWCMKPFSRSDLSAIEDALVCTACKPAYVESLRKQVRRGEATRYLFSAKTAEGEQVTEHVEAANIDAASYELQLRGYTEVSFHEDDIMAASRRLFKIDPAFQPEQTPEQAFKILHRPATLSNAFLDGLKRFWPLHLIVAFIIFYQYRNGTPFSWIAITAYVFITIQIAIFYFVMMPMVVFNQLIAAVEWAQWDSVEKIVNRIRTLNPFMIAKIPEFELDIRAAQVQAFRGELPGALRSVEKYGTDPKVEPFLYHVKRASVCSTAKDYDQLIAMYKLAIEAAPSIGGNYLDLAMYLVMRKHDVEQAKYYLEQGTQRTLPALAAPWRSFVPALIAAEEGNHEAADAGYQETLQKQVEFRHLPFMTGFANLVKSFELVTAAARGDLPRARALYQQVKPWLITTHEDELHARCERALGESATASHSA